MSFVYLLSSIRTRPWWRLSLKKSLTEQPARPEDAHAQAQAQDDAQAHEEAQAHDDAQEPDLLECELPLERGVRTGTFTTFTLIYVSEESPYL